jgi:phosphodiesterase/alkaline phosphatase D-like protein
METHSSKQQQCTQQHKQPPVLVDGLTVFTYYETHAPHRYIESARHTLSAEAYNSSSYGTLTTASVLAARKTLTEQCTASRRTDDMLLTMCAATTAAATTTVHYLYEFCVIFY